MQTKNVYSAPHHSFDGEEVFIFDKTGKKLTMSLEEATKLAYAIVDDLDPTYESLTAIITRRPPAEIGNPSKALKESKAANTKVATRLPRTWRYGEAQYLILKIAKEEFPKSIKVKLVADKLGITDNATRTQLRRLKLEGFLSHEPGASDTHPSSWTITPSGMDRCADLRSKFEP